MIVARKTITQQPLSKLNSNDNVQEIPLLMAVSRGFLLSRDY